jgi:hypothetical protein
MVWRVSVTPQLLSTPGKTRYPFCRRLDGPQGRSGQVWKISPPTGIRSPDRPARSLSLYRLSYPACCWFILYDYITIHGAKKTKKQYVCINCKVVGKYNKVLHRPHGTHLESQEMPNRSGATTLTFIVLKTARHMVNLHWSSDVNFISHYNFRWKVLRYDS